MTVIRIRANGSILTTGLALVALLALGCGTSTSPSPLASASSAATTPRPLTTPLPPSVAISSAPTSPVASATSVASSPATTASSSVSLCASDQHNNGTGSAGLGQTTGSIATGRILFVIETAAGPSGTIALAYIDHDGFHEIPGVTEWTTAHATWETPTTVVFDSGRADDRHLFRADLSDDTTTQLTDAFRVAQQSADILGDGRIVHDTYSCADITDLGLSITAADGSTTTNLTPARQSGDPGFDAEAAVAPDGHTIAFVRHVDDNTGALFTIDASGGTATRLMPDADHVAYPRWSPDGKSILFSQNVPAGATDLWTIPAAGGTPKRITKSDPGSIRWESDWSPDGMRIVFKYFQSGWHYNELHIADADGSNESTLWTGDLSTAETPHWGP